jgi:hypothetical protein
MVLILNQVLWILFVPNKNCKDYGEIENGNVGSNGTLYNQKTGIVHNMFATML